MTGRRPRMLLVAALGLGIISATGRSNVGIVDYEDFIQTDAAINPGNSGGALAVPSNLARQVVQQLATSGRVVRGWVGITRIADVAEDGLRVSVEEAGAGA